MSQPKRIVRSRAKGWRMPEGAIYVGRPTQWGNPWRFGLAKDGRWDVDGPGWTGMLPFGSEQDARHAVVRLFRAYLERRGPYGAYPPWLDDDLEQLRGHDLVCWCPIGLPCHAEVLLELANAPVGQ